MKKMFLVVMFCFCMSWVSAQSEGITFLENLKWEEVKVIALKANKPIYVYCYTKWCGPCNGFKRMIFPLKEVGDYFNKNFVSVKYDMESEVGVDFIKSTHRTISHYPTHLYVNPKGDTLIHRSQGYKQAQEFIDDAKMAVSDQGLNVLQARYDSGQRDFDFFKKYAMAYYKSGERAEACRMVNDYYMMYHLPDSLLSKDKFQFYSQFLYTDLSHKLCQDLIAGRADYARLSLGNIALLNSDVYRMLRISTMSLTTIEQTNSDGQLQLPIDEAMLKVINMTLEKLDNDPTIEDVVTKIEAYNYQRKEKYVEARDAIRKGIKKRYKSFSAKYVTSNYLYMAQHNPNKAYVNTLITDLELLKTNLWGSAGLISNVIKRLNLITK